jgi:hypothetical protein
VLPTYGVSVAVDTSSGNHAAYALYTGTDEQGNQPATYAYCPSQCANPQKWSSIRLDEEVQDVRLALDQYGHPRLTLNEYDPKPEPPMKIQWLLLASFLTAWLILALVFFVPNL